MKALTDTIFSTADISHCAEPATLAAGVTQDRGLAITITEKPQNTKGAIAYW